NFLISVRDVKTATRELLTRVEINIKSGENHTVDPSEFWVAYTDFPLIDNLRLSGDQRFALVLRNFDEKLKQAQVRGVIFPGSHASLKEPTYLQDILDQYLKDKSSSSDSLPWWRRWLRR